jgi:hypothetical protein
MLLKSRSHAKQLLHTVNHHPLPHTWAIVPGKAMMQDQDLHHTLSPFLSRIDLQYVGVVHKRAHSLEDLQAWLDSSFAPPRLTRHNIANVLLDYVRFPPLETASAEPPLQDMVRLSFAMDMIEDTLNHSLSRRCQRFLLIVLAWVTIHKARDTPKPYFGEFKIQPTDSEAECPLHTVSRAVWSSLDSQARGKAVIKDRYEMLSYTKTGKWMVTLKVP